jgi:prepilin-type N-terminal cleavage/methylation domain-containing protein
MRYFKKRDGSRRIIPGLLSLVKAQRGFTLIEILVAIALIGLIADIVLISSGTLAKSFRILNVHEIAKDIAINDMEQIKSQPFADNYLILNSSCNPSGDGQAVTFTATVTPSTAAGSVTFFHGNTEDVVNTELGSSPVSSGNATWTSPLSVGSHYFKAEYYNNGTTSPKLKQIVNSSPSLSQSSQNYYAQMITHIDVTWLSLNKQQIDITIYYHDTSGNPIFKMTDYRVNY